MYLWCWLRASWLGLEEACPTPRTHPSGPGAQHSQGLQARYGPHKVILEKHLGGCSRPDCLQGREGCCFFPTWPFSVILSGFYPCSPRPSLPGREQWSRRPGWPGLGRMAELWTALCGTSFSNQLRSNRNWEEKAGIGGLWLNCWALFLS